MFVNHVHLMPASMREDATIDAFLRLADATGIEGAVLFAPFSYQLEGSGLDQNDWLASQIANRPNLIGYGTLDPKRPAREQVERIAGLGFRGAKMHPAAQKFPVAGAWAHEAYEALAERGLVVDFHTGVHWHRIADYDPVQFDEAARHTPTLPMVFEHVGGWHFFRQMVGVMVNNQHAGNRLYAGIASVLDRDDQKYWYLGPEGLHDLRWQIGADRLVYGLDFPYNGRAKIERDLAVIGEMGWPDADVAALLGGNLRTLLGI